MRNVSDTCRVIPGAEAVLRIQDYAPGVLLLHGFRGSPHEMKYLGDRIYRSGYSIYIPRYPGHGTSLQDMTCTGMHDWFTAAREAYLEMCRHCPVVHIVGLSMGGLFSILLADQFGPENIVLLSTPHTIADKRIWFAPLLGLFKKIIYEKDELKGVRDPDARAGHICYHEGIPVRQTWELFRLMRHAMVMLKDVNSRALIIQSKLDDRVPEDSCRIIYETIASAKKEIITVEHSGHAITVDFDRDIVADAVISFLDNGR